MLRICSLFAVACLSLMLAVSATADPPTKHKAVKHKSAETQTAMLSRALLAAAKAKLPEIRKNMAGGGVSDIGDGTFSPDSKCTVGDVGSYDVQRTNSLISPYIGYVLVPVVWRSSIKQYHTKEEAQSAPLEDVDEHNLRLTFAYQSGKWLFKSQRKD